MDVTISVKYYNLYACNILWKLAVNCTCNKVLLIIIKDTFVLVQVHVLLCISSFWYSTCTTQLIFSLQIGVGQYTPSTIPV